MAFQPQAPFPKSRGDMVRSTDWNDLVGEVPETEVWVDDQPVPFARELWLPLMWCLIR